MSRFFTVWEKKQTYKISKEDARHGGKLLIYTQFFFPLVDHLLQQPAKLQLDIQLQILKLF